MDNDYDSLFPLPLSTSDCVGFSFAIFGLMIAAGGGIGGGGMLVPIYIIIMGFSPKYAIPLSNITVFGGALANTILNVEKKHPIANRPLIDWDLILVMEPLTIAGALVGTLIHKVLPEIILLVMLVVLLSFTAYTTLRKAVQMFSIETAINQLANGDSAELMINSERKDAEHIEEGMFENEPLVRIMEDEKVVPRWNVLILIITFVVVIILNILKGGGAFPSPLGIECGSISFWLSYAIILGWTFWVAHISRKRLIDKHEEKLECNYRYLASDLIWDKQSTLIYPAISSLAGLFAGTFGIGGGIVKGPLMLAMGVHPKVASASSACMILFTSFTATTSYIVFGLLIPEYALVCFVIGFLSTIVGQKLIFYLMNRYQRNSLIAFSVGFVVLLSAISMTAESILSGTAGVDMETGHICAVDQ
mmetsp:Transcript_9936/g.17645  ORF Transcript_9936/g.17645 Transcript_9936/m.17645 type:complete len:420 (-) Transcript_9936:18-1277(-)